MGSSLWILIYSLTVFRRVHSQTSLENSLVDAPKIVCGARNLSLSVDTKEVFHGNIYAKGFFSNSNCKLKGNGNLQSLTISLPLNTECGVRRQRTLNPRGLVLDATIIIMFHPVFITKMDRSYHIRCHYMDSDTIVTKTIDVNALPPTELTNNSENLEDSAHPVCQYEVLTGGPNGSPLKFATVGESVYHKWTCSTTNSDLYCMTVHSCTADDGQGLGQQLINSDGCTTDSFIIPQLDYDNTKLQAGQNSQVFKFADRQSVYFSCQIRLLLKDELNGECPRPKDYCNASMATTAPTVLLMPTTQLTPEEFAEVVEDDFPAPHSFSVDEGSPNLPDGLDPLTVTKAKRMRHRSRLIRNIDSLTTIEVDVSAPTIDVIEKEEEVFINDRRTSQDRIDSKVEQQVCVSLLFFAVFCSLLLAIMMFSLVLYFLLIRRSEICEKSVNFTIANTS